MLGWPFSAAASLTWRTLGLIWITGGFIFRGDTGEQPGDDETEDQPGEKPQQVCAAEPCT